MSAYVDPDGVGPYLAPELAARYDGDDAAAAARYCVDRYGPDPALWPDCVPAAVRAAAPASRPTRMWDRTGQRPVTVLSTDGSRAYVRIEGAAGYASCWMGLSRLYEMTPEQQAAFPPPQPRPSDSAY